MKYTVKQEVPTKLWAEIALKSMLQFNPSILGERRRNILNTQKSVWILEIFGSIYINVP